MRQSRAARRSSKEAMASRRLHRSPHKQASLARERKLEPKRTMHHIKPLVGGLALVTKWGTYTIHK